MSGAAPTEAASAGRLAIPAQQQQFLAFDFGSKRTGVASGNRLLAHAPSPPAAAASPDPRSPLPSPPSLLPSGSPGLRPCTLSVLPGLDLPQPSVAPGPAR